MSIEPLKDRVERAFANAKANGYDFNGWSLAEIARDMKECDADLQDENEDDLIPLIAELKRHA